MSDETLRTLVTSSATVLTTTVGAFLVSFLQNNRERAKEAREARAKRHEDRRTALLGVCSALYRSEMALGSAEANRLLQTAYQANTKRVADELGKMLSKPFPPQLEELRKDVLGTLRVGNEKAAQASDKSIDDLLAHGKGFREALDAASNYGDYPAELKMSTTLAYDLHGLFGTYKGVGSDSAGDYRSNIMSIARDISALAGWEADCAHCAHSGEPSPPLPSLRYLRSLQRELEGSERKPEPLGK